MAGSTDKGDTLAGRMAADVLARAREAASAVRERYGARKPGDIPLIPRADGSIADMGDAWWDEDFAAAAPHADDGMAGAESVQEGFERNAAVMLAQQSMGGRRARRAMLDTVPGTDGGAVAENRPQPPRQDEAPAVPIELSADEALRADIAEALADIDEIDEGDPETLRNMRAYLKLVDQIDYLRATEAQTAGPPQPSVRRPVVLAGAAAQVTPFVTGAAVAMVAAGLGLLAGSLRRR